MADITVAELANEIGTPVERLVSQLADSGVKKSAADAISQDEKELEPKKRSCVHRHHILIPTGQGPIER